MKIKIVVRPEDARKAETEAEVARRVRQKRVRWGLAALLGLVTLSAAVALFFIARGSGPEERPVAAESSGKAAGEGTKARGSAAPSSGSGAVAPADQGGHGTTGSVPGPVGAGQEAGGEAAVDEAGAAVPGEAGELPAPPEAPGHAAAPDDGTAGGNGGTPAAAVPVPGAAAPPPAGKPSPSAPGEAAKAPVVAKAPAKPGTGVVRSQLASGVVNREPMGTLQSPVAIGPGGREVYYFNEFRNLRGQTVTHRWEYNGQVVASVPFRIEGNRWRVYSSKRIREDQRGAWRVTTVDKSGSVLSRAEFRAE